MKKITLLNLALISVTLLHGQAIKYKIKNSEKVLKQKKELKNAISVIENEQLNTMKADLFPEKVLDYTIANSNENEELSKSYLSGKRIELTQMYSKPLNNKNEKNAKGYMENMNSLVSIVSQPHLKKCVK